MKRVNSRGLFFIKHCGGFSLNEEQVEDNEPEAAQSNGLFTLIVCFVFASQSREENAWWDWTWLLGRPEHMQVLDSSDLLQSLLVC